MNTATTTPKIPTPTPNEVKKYLKKWNEKTGESYARQERSLRKLFQETYPLNDELDDVLIKVSALDNLYNTMIQRKAPSAVVTVAEHIIALHQKQNIDERLDKQDFELVAEIAVVQINDSKKINFYSFASKYCSHHRPMAYPIYDSYVEKVLKYFMREDEFDTFKLDDLKEYPRYRKVLLKFRKHYQLTEFNFKEMDMYLWQVGREYLPSNY